MRGMRGGNVEKGTRPSLLEVARRMLRVHLTLASEREKAGSAMPGQSGSAAAGKHGGRGGGS